MVNQGEATGLVQVLGVQVLVSVVFVCTCVSHSMKYELHMVGVNSVIIRRYSKKTLVLYVGIVVLYHVEFCLVNTTVTNVP